MVVIPRHQQLNILPEEPNENLLLNFLRWGLVSAPEEK